MFVDSNNSMLESCGIYDVSGGAGSLIYLVVGTEKTAVVDAGMAYSADKMVENIKEILGDRPLDYVLLTHSHYDHASGVSALKKAWPQTVVCGGAYAKHIFESDKAKLLISGLNDIACKLYTGKSLTGFSPELLAVDHVMAEGDKISLGNHEITLYETPGHTRCSVTYLMDETYLFACESIGVVKGDWDYYPTYLISYKDSAAAVEKCASLPARYVLIPHSFICDLEESPQLWDVCRKGMEDSKALIMKLYKEHGDIEAMLEGYASVYRDKDSEKEHPWEAFAINARSLMGAVVREFKED